MADDPDEIIDSGLPDLSDVTFDHLMTISDTPQIREALQRVLAQIRSDRGCQAEVTYWPWLSREGDPDALPAPDE